MIRGALQQTYSSGESLDGRGKDEAEKLLDQLIKKAIKQRASSIHIEPNATSTSVRYRIDGTLIKATSISKHLHNPLVRSIKQRAGLDHRFTKADQASFEVSYDKMLCSVYVVTVLTPAGERVVLHLAPSQTAAASLESLGFWGQSLDVIHSLIAKQRGLLLITGSDDSGADKTLSTITSMLAHPAISVATIHDGTSTNHPMQNIPSDTALKLALQQHPDVVVIENIDTKELFQIALDAAKSKLIIAVVTAPDVTILLTKLFSWNSHQAPEIAQLLLGIIEQKQLPLLCSECRIKHLPRKQKLHEIITNTPHFIDLLHMYQISQGLTASDTLTPYKINRDGCKSCNKTGTIGQTVISQIVINNDKLQKIFLVRPLSLEIVTTVIEQACIVPIMSDISIKAAAGIVTWPPTAKTSLTQPL